MGISFGLAGRVRKTMGRRGDVVVGQKVDDPARTAAELVDSVLSGKPTDLELVIQAARLVVSTRFATPTLLIRRLHVTPADASRILDRLQHCEVVAPPEGNKPRRVLTTSAELPAVIEEFIARG